MTPYSVTIPVMSSAGVMSNAGPQIGTSSGDVSCQTAFGSRPHPGARWESGEGLHECGRVVVLVVTSDVPHARQRPRQVHGCGPGCREVVAQSPYVAPDVSKAKDVTKATDEPGGAGVAGDADGGGIPGQNQSVDGFHLTPNVSKPPDVSKAKDAAKATDEPGGGAGVSHDHHSDHGPEPPHDIGHGPGGG